MADIPLDLGLDDQLCFALYGAALAVNRAYKPMLDQLGITYPQYLVLAVLWEQDAQAIGEIAERLSLEPSTITPLAKRMEIAGLIVRQRNPRNERQVVVSLTDAGRDMRRRCTCLGEKLLAASGMSFESMLAFKQEVQTFRDEVAGSLNAIS